MRVHAYARTYMPRSCCALTRHSVLHAPQVKSMLDFYERSYFFKDLLNFNHCLQKASDLSQLWYREYHLELTMGTMIQVRCPF